METMGGRTWPTLVCFFVDFGHDKRILLVTQLLYADKRIVKIMKVFIDTNNLQLELIRYSKKNFTLFTFTCTKRQIRPLNT